MNRDIRALEVNEYKMNTWESAFANFVNGVDVERSIKIMKAIDPEFTEMLLDNETTNENTITVYHGTHENIEQFTNREVKNYDSIGTYFTSNKEYARMLYGKNVIAAKIKLNNPLIVNNVIDCESFDKVFYDTTLTNKPFSDIDKLLLDTDYINSLKNKLINKGYDSIVFKDSRIDLNKEDKEPHTVYIIFNANDIKVIK